MNMMTTMEPSRTASRGRRKRRRDLAAETALATATRFERLSALFTAFDRDDMEAGVDLLIAALDRMDGDSDLEPNGDELDDCMSEEGFHPQSRGWNAEPGCPISDPGGSAEDGMGDPTWIEWQTRGRHKVDAFGAELLHRGRHGYIEPDDAEDDDPREANGDEADTDNAEDGFGHACLVTGYNPLHFFPGANRPGCPLADGDGGDEHDGREPSGDEEDGSGAEDEPVAAFFGYKGPGCPLSDPGGLEGCE